MADLRKAAQQALEALIARAKRGDGAPDTIAALRAALEQPEQEPVATVAMDVSGAHLSWNGKYLGQKPDTKIAMLLKDLPVGTLLFTAPPRREWESLTEEEILKVADAHPIEGFDSEIITFVLDIEAALKEKNA